MLLQLCPIETNANQLVKKIGGLTGYFSVAVGKSTSGVLKELLKTGK